MTNKKKTQIANKLVDAIHANYPDQSWANKAQCYKAVFSLRIKGVRLGELAEQDDDMMHVVNKAVSALRNATFRDDIEVDI